MIKKLILNLLLLCSITTYAQTSTSLDSLVRSMIQTELSKNSFRLGAGDGLILKQVTADSAVISTTISLTTLKTQLDSASAQLLRTRDSVKTSFAEIANLKKLVSDLSALVNTNNINVTNRVTAIEAWIRKPL